MDDKLESTEKNSVQFVILASKVLFLMLGSEVQQTVGASFGRPHTFIQLIRKSRATRYVR
jgi:hypothetical protein